MTEKSLSFILNNGLKMPAIGLGTYRIRNANTILTTLDYALSTGYRMIDTAAVYGNEAHINNALKVLLPKHDLEREDIFITTKLSPSDLGDKKKITAAYKKSLDNLGVEYVDLYLIHFPGSARIHHANPQNILLRDSTWHALTELYDEGLINSIGVSNFTVKHLKELMRCNYGVVPVVNQVEWHPYYHQPELKAYCTKEDIVIQAYGSLGGTNSEKALLEDHVVKKIAANHNATCAQVLLRWAIQQDVAVIPKSTNPVRIKENITHNFKLGSDEIKALNALGEKNIKYAWDPSPIL